MARIVQSNAIFEDREALANDNTRLWVYNGMDCCATGKVRANPDLCRVVASEGHAIPYRFVRAMQGPALDIMLRGVCVNQLEKVRTSERLRRGQEAAQEILDALANAVWGQGLNAGSPKQLIAFFYTALKLPPQYAIRKTPEGKKRTLSCDHKALETLAKLETKGPGVDPYDRNFEKVRLAAPIVKMLLHIREYGKKRTVVNSFGERFKFAVGVASTKTARWATFSNAFGEGSNSQNITEEMRRPLCADEGMKLYNADLEQAESRWVAALVWQATGDDGYWKACEGGDLHTICCTLTFTETFKQFGAWNVEWGRFDGDLKAARVLAETKWYRHLSYRDGNKRIGHGSNYWGTAFGIAGQIGDVEVKVVRDFQARYFRAFPSIPKWHAHVIKTVQTTNELWTVLGRRRIFFGRTQDDATLREAMAHIPQSSNGELLNCMLYRVWRYGIDGGTISLADGRVVPFRPNCQLLLQVHDSFVWQGPDDPQIEAAVIAKVLELAAIPIPIHRAATNETRTLTIPLEVKTGWNWARQDKELFSDGNPDGLTKWRGPATDNRTRQQRAKPSLQDWMG